MSDNNFGDRREKPLEIYRKLEVSTLNSIRKILPDWVIERACRKGKGDILLFRIFP